jgi:RNA polymerase sigma-70 factor (ECF subfamily)
MGHSEYSSNNGVPAFQFTDAYLSALREGDAATTDHFFQYFCRALSASLRRRIASPSLIDDIQQETFARVVRAVSSHTVQEPERFAAFVFAVCRNVTREYLRHDHTAESAEDHDSADERPGPEALARASELGRMLANTMALLAERDQRLLSMAVLEDMSHKDIAVRLRTKQSSIPVLLHRAKARLRQQLTIVLSADKPMSTFGARRRFSC